MDREASQYVPCTQEEFEEEKTDDKAHHIRYKILKGSDAPVKCELMYRGQPLVENDKTSIVFTTVEGKSEYCEERGIGCTECMGFFGHVLKPICHNTDMHNELQRLKGEATEPFEKIWMQLILEANRNVRAAQGLNPHDIVQPYPYWLPIA